MFWSQSCSVSLFVTVPLWATHSMSLSCVSTSVQYNDDEPHGIACKEKNCKGSAWHIVGTQLVRVRWVAGIVGASLIFTSPWVPWDNDVQCFTLSYQCIAQSLAYSRYWMRICWKKKKWNLVERKRCLPLPREKEREGQGVGERERERHVLSITEVSQKPRYTNPMIDLGPWTPP